MQLKYIIVVVVLLGGVISYPLWQHWLQQPAATATASNNAGQPLPRISFPLLNESTITTDSLKGRRAIINFWASWCAPCVIEFPHLLEFAANHPEVVLIAVSLDSNREDISSFLDARASDGLPENFHIVWDTDRSISAQAFGTYRLPETYFVNEAGIITEKIVGVVQPAQLQAWMQP